MAKKKRDKATMIAVSTLVIVLLIAVATFVPGLLPEKVGAMPNLGCGFNPSGSIIGMNEYACQIFAGDMNLASCFANAYNPSNPDHYIKVGPYKGQPLPNEGGKFYQCRHIHNNRWYYWATMP